MKNNKGVTMVALIIMVIVITFLTVVTTTTGLNIIQESRYSKAIAEMKIMQTKVNELYDEYRDNKINPASYGTQIDTPITEDIEDAYESVFDCNENIGDLSDFRYYSADYIKNTLDVDGVDGDYIINIETRTVIYIDGVEGDGNVFYSLEEIEGEQFNVEYENKYKVTFDADGGTLSQNKKTVFYGEPYGELPTPTKEGYTFLGWNGKNKLLEINEDNWILDANFQNRISVEYGIEGEFKYFRVYGYQSNDNIDTSWRLKNNNIIQLNNAKRLTTSMYVRSENTKSIQYLKKKTGPNDGKTGINKNGTFIATIEQDCNWNNDGKWYKIETNINIPNDADDGFFVIGNDIPNIYGIGSYLDIANIQLEEGEVATEYEPYFVTSTTKVTQEKDHTLKAIWEKEKWKCVVSFDANGGNVAEASRVVFLGEEYGDLPTPTREGYTFLGWNGKNKFNEEESTQNAYIRKSGNRTMYNGSNGMLWSCSDYIEVEGGKTYNFNPNSTKGNDDTAHCIYDANKVLIGAIDTGAQTIVMPINAKYLRVSFRSTTATYYPSSNIQLEEGDVATEYEPFYVTGTTKVTQEKDHTLKAIWQEN